MIFTKMNQTLVATALLVTSMILGAPTAEGILQEKQGNLRRQLDDSPQSRVELLTAGKFAILSKTGVSTVGTTSVTGVMGTSPISATALTGFGLIADSSNTSQRPLLCRAVFMQPTMHLQLPTCSR
jgi:hypothetical protein